jgi:hypothetical protein
VGHRGTGVDVTAALSDAGLVAGLRRQIRVRGRTLRWVAVLLIVAGIGAWSTLPLLPLQVAQSVGTDVEVTAQVRSVATRPGERDRHAKRDGPRWYVRASWTDGGVARTGEGWLRARAQPFQVGDQVVVHTLAGGSRVSFRSDGSARGTVGIIVVGGLLLFVPGLIVLFRGPLRRRRLVGIATHTAPLRLVPTAVVGRAAENGGPNRTRTSRKGCNVRFRTADGREGLLELDDRPDDLREPRENDELLLWRVPGSGEKPCAVLRSSDRTWWMGTTAHQVDPSSS